MRNPVLLLIGWISSTACLMPVKSEPLLRMSCLDTVNTRQLFLEGELEEVYSLWQNYFRNAIQNKGTIERDCTVKGNKMMGILNLHLSSRRDSNLANQYFAMLLKLSPREEMWELWLPIETQTYWDGFREGIGRDRTSDEIWADRWLPPISYTKARDSTALALRRAYHRSRLLYANGRDDAEAYFKIINDTRDLRDPTFTLLRTDAMLRLGVNLSQTRKELDKFNGFGGGYVVSEGQLIGWRGRLGSIIKERSETLERKDTIRLSEPRVQIRGRNHKR